MNISQPLAYNFPWENLRDDQYRQVAREYLDWGVDSFVFTEGLVKACLDSPERRQFLHTLAKEMGVRFIAMHGMCGLGHDLNTIDPEMRKRMLDAHRRSMELDAQFGGLTYTVHVGAPHYVFDHVSVPILRKLAEEALEQLVPMAERIGVVVAVENSFEPPNSAKEVLGLVKPLAGSHAIGVCYDTGHAQHMAPYPWKDPAKYAGYMARSWWEGLVEEANAIETLAPYVVTTHIHDNSGYADQHGMPFDGTIKWDVLMPKLFACPRMMEFPTEINFSDEPNWAGVPLAPPGGYSIKRQVETFRKLGFQ